MKISKSDLETLKTFIVNGGFLRVNPITNTSSEEDAYRCINLVMLSFVFAMNRSILVIQKRANNH